MNSKFKTLKNICIITATFVMCSSISHAQNAATNGLYGNYGAAATAPAMIPSATALPNQPWSQQWGTPYGQNSPYSAFSGQTGVNGANGTNGTQQNGNATNSSVTPNNNNSQQQNTPAASSAKAAKDAQQRQADFNKREAQFAVSNPNIKSTNLMPGDHVKGNPIVINGDTLSFNGQLVHLSGVKSPAITETCTTGPTSWRCGRQAKEHLDDLVSNGEVDCIIVSLGSPPEGECKIGRDDISSVVIADGMGTTKDPLLIPIMNESKADLRGIWTK